jgi:hypothetical protein
VPNTFAHSLGAEFGVYPGSFAQIQTDGHEPSDSGSDTATTNGVNLTNGNPANFVITYNPLTDLVTETISQTNSLVLDTETITSNLDLSSVIGNGGSAYVGFTGSDGGFGANQTISNFSYTGLAAVPEPASMGLMGLAGMALLSRRRMARRLI